MILTDLYHLFKDLRSSNFEDSLARISIGCSFNPEHWILYNASQDDPEITLKVAKYTVEELRIKDIRLSIRWSKVWMDGRISMDYYHDLFQYFFSKDVKICLNIGPIKTMRWPEEQVPESVLNNLKTIPEKRAVISSESELGKISIDYLRDLLNYLSKYFSETHLSKIISFQGNNEAFYNFGEYEWTITHELEVKVIELIHQYFPNKKIMINSAGRTNLKEVLLLINELEENISDLSGNFVIGYNYYYRVPNQTKFPLLGYLDNLVSLRLFQMSMKRFKRICKDKNIQIEISELQGEPWGELTTPGNSFQEFKFSLVRCTDRILNLDDDRKSTIRFWGIEAFALKFLQNNATDENLQIRNLIQKTNF